MKFLHNLTFSLMVLAFFGCGADEANPPSLPSQSAAETTPSTTQNPGPTAPSGETSPEENPTEGNPSDETPAEETPDPLAEFEARFTGSYAQLNSVTTIQSLPILGESDVVTQTYGLTTITREGDQFMITESGCHVEPTPGVAVTTTIPDSIPRSVPTTAEPLSIWEENGEIRWSRGEKIILIGANLQNPRTEALPTSSDDERVWDQDGDGNPGITVAVEGLFSGDIYAVQRIVNSYTGTITNEDNFTGLVSEELDQEVIGATNNMLNRDIPIVAHPDADQSTIQIVRVEQGLTCDQFIEQKDSLF